MIFTDVMNQLQALNLSLQAQTIFSFHNKIKLSQRHFNTKSLQHFPLLKGLVNCGNDLCSEKINMCVECLEIASTNFATRFSDIEKIKPTFAFLVNPFVVDVEKGGCPVHKPIVTQTANIEAGLLDLQQDFALKSVHQSQSTVEFSKQVSVDKYPALRQTSQRPLSILGTYSCESTYSAMKYVKSKNLAVLTNQHLKELLRTATTCYVTEFMKIETHKSTWKCIVRVNI